MTRRLEIAACRRLCQWEQTDDVRDAESLFACASCGSEWLRSEPWTPVDCNGLVPEAVQEERRRGRG